MARSYSLNNSQSNKLQIAWRSVLRPMLLLSLGIHAIALWIPLPSKPTHADKAADQTITITQLPPQEPAPPAAVKPVPAAVAGRPLVNVPPKPAIRSVLRSVPSSPIASSAGLSSSVAPRRSSSSSQPPAAAPAASPVVDAFLNDFPQYPGAQPGSFGLPPSYESLSHKTSDAIDAVDTWFQQQLPGKGFAVAPVEQSSQQMVYRVAKGGVTEFLSLVPNPAGGTNILLIPDPLQGGSSEQSMLPTGDAKFTTDLAAILPTPTTRGWQSISSPAAVLAEPQAFFQESGTPPALRSGGESAAYGENQSVDAVFADLRAKFQSAEIDLILQGDYGGGRLYQLTRNGANRFFSLVPTPDGKSTVVVVWSQSPL
ncbi:MAG TPA: hypothetical protein V6C57_08235 [Coleofasciculaceae cyanobacterium]